MSHAFLARQRAWLDAMGHRQEDDARLWAAIREWDDLRDFMGDGIAISNWAYSMGAGYLKLHSYNGGIRCRPCDRAMWTGINGDEYFDMGNNYYAKALFSLYLEAPMGHWYENINQETAGDILEFIFGVAWAYPGVHHHLVWRDLFEQLVISIEKIMTFLPRSHYIDHRGVPHGWPYLVDEVRLFFLHLGLH